MMSQVPPGKVLVVPYSMTQDEKPLVTGIHLRESGAIIPDEEVGLFEYGHAELLGPQEAKSYWFGSKSCPWLIVVRNVNGKPELTHSQK
jgi:hypothetical protein